MRLKNNKKLSKEEKKLIKAAKKEAATKSKNSQSNEMSDDFSADLIKELNKEAGTQIAFNLGAEDAPTNIKRWISTGSRQLDCVLANKVRGGLPEGRIVEIQGPSSCHAKGEKVLMFDGTLKRVEDVKIGDKLMGPDSTNRAVVDLVSGKDDLYRVTQKKTMVSHVFNQRHILALKKSKKEETTFIPINEFVAKSKYFRELHQWFHVDVKQFGNTSTGAEEKATTQRNHTIDPYVLGCLIGDGHLSKKRIELTTSDEEISRAYVNEIKYHGFSPRFHEKKGNKAFGIYYATGNYLGVQVNENNDKDTIRQGLQSLGLLGKKSGNKFIPQSYKTSSYTNRLEILAGLLDTDGHNNRNSNFDFVSKSKQLAEDVAFVARSVGLMVSVREKQNKSYGTYHRVCITGNIDKIPTRLARKKVVLTEKRKNVPDLRTGIEVEKVGYGEYYGFTVDKDHLYLSDDFSVIHNSGKSHICFEIAKSTQKMGGIVVYMDTENATNLENLETLGINVHNRFVFVQTACTEEIFAVAESAILKARSMAKNVPVTIIWDSIAASSPKAELEGDYDQNSIGLQARALGKGMRKIVNIIGNQNVLFLLINQQRKNIGVMFGDDCVTPDTRITIRKRV